MIDFSLPYNKPHKRSSVKKDLRHRATERVAITSLGLIVAQIKSRLSVHEHVFH
jgi:hypothetical protein